MSVRVRTAAMRCLSMLLMRAVCRHRCSRVETGSEGINSYCDTGTRRAQRTSATSPLEPLLRKLLRKQRRPKRTLPAKYVLPD